MIMHFVSLAPLNLLKIHFGQVDWQQALEISEKKDFLEKNEDSAGTILY